MNFGHFNGPNLRAAQFAEAPGQHILGLVLRADEHVAINSIQSIERDVRAHGIALMHAGGMQNQSAIDQLLRNAERLKHLKRAGMHDGGA